MQSSMFSSYKSIIKAKNHQQITDATKQLTALVASSLKQINLKDNCTIQIQQLINSIQKCINNITSFHAYVANLDPELAQIHQKSIAPQKALINKGNQVTNKLNSILAQHTNALHEYELLIATAAAATAMLQSKRPIEQIAEMLVELQIIHDKICKLHNALNEDLCSLIATKEELRTPKLQHNT